MFYSIFIVTNAEIRQLDTTSTAMLTAPPPLNIDLYYKYGLICSVIYVHISVTSSNSNNDLNL